MKKLLLFLSIAICGIATAQIPTSGLVAWYPFNGNANDSSGNNYNATTITATLTTDRFGNSNSAYYFDGGIGQYIEVPFITPFISNAHTVCAWINTEQSNIGRLVVSPMGGGQHFSLNVNNNKANIYTDCACVNVPTQTSINDSTWYHIVGVLDSATQTMAIYLNGVLDSNSTCSFSSISVCYPTQNLNMGRFPGFGEYFTGAMDEVLIYNRALTPTEIGNLFNPVGINENADGTISIYPNPFSSQTILQTAKQLTNATLTVDNCFGQTVAQIKNISGQTITFNRDNLASGLYFVRLTQDNKVIAVDKLVITDK